MSVDEFKAIAPPDEPEPRVDPLRAALERIAAIRPAGAAPKLREAIRIARDALQESARCAE